MSLSVRILAASVTVLACLAGWCAGCTSTTFGSDLSTMPAPRLIREIEPTTYNLPAGEPFSIRLSQSSEQASLVGVAKADAEAKREGEGRATASVENGGQASGTIQIGHLFKNDTSRQIDFEIHIQYRYEFEIGIMPAERAVGGTTGIKLYTKDQRNRVLREFDLVSHSTEQGSAERKSDDEIRFPLTLDPNDSVAVFLAGQTSVNVEAGKTANGTLRIYDLRMTVSTKPAPAVAPPAASSAPAGNVPR